MRRVFGKELMCDQFSIQNCQRDLEDMKGIIVEVVLIFNRKILSAV
jgi:hypothetical protein